MAQVLVPARSAEDWKLLLASPDRHWKAGYSAMTLARSWQDANGFPPEIRAAFAASSDSHLRTLEPLLIIPEFKVPLPLAETELRRPTSSSWHEQRQDS